jgi:hypothetical protein
MYITSLHVIYSRIWDNVEKKSYRYYFDKVEEEKDYRKGLNIFKMIIDIPSHLRLYHYQDCKELHMFRNAIMGALGLQEPFMFSLYLKYCLRDVTIKLLQIKPISLFIIILIIWGNYFRFRLNFWNNESFEGLTALIIFGVLLMLINMLLLISGVWMYNVLLKKRYITQWQDDNSRVINDETSLLMNFKENLNSGKFLQEKIDQKKIFFFRRPKYYIAILQVLLLSQAWYFGITGLYVLNEHNIPFRDILIFALYPIVSFVFFCPTILKIMSVTMYTGRLVNLSIIKKTIKRQNKYMKNVLSKSSFEE